MNAKEKWINETENSLAGLKPAEVNPYLYSKIINRLSTTIETAPPKLVWASAALFAVLLLLNFFALKTETISKQKNTSEIQTLARQYQLMNDNTFNYN